MRRGLVAAALLLGLLAAAPGRAADVGLVEPRLVEPRLTVPKGGPAAPRVALTFDACDGAADQRIIGTLVENHIPATFFVTARWVARNRATLATLAAHPDLFAIENHGARHLPAIDREVHVYGLAAAGSPAAVLAEVEGGARAIVAATGRSPIWFRGAAALYTTDSLAIVQAAGMKVAGYSLGADGGGVLGAGETERRLAAARDGDVVLAHVNQPMRPAGAGVAAGILALRDQGFRFVGLEEAIGSIAPARLPRPRVRPLSDGPEPAK